MNVATKNASNVPNQPPPTPSPRLGAAALAYDKTKQAAPKLTAKGQGLVAEKILAVAAAHNIPIRQDADLLSILSKVELDTEVPIEVYAVVAEIFAYLYQTNAKAKATP